MCSTYFRFVSTSYGYLGCRTPKGLSTQAGMLTPAQLRAARALLGWSRDQLAETSGTSAETVKGFELRGTDPKLSTLNAWRRALEKGGVLFVEPDPLGEGLGPGVRLRSILTPRSNLAKAPGEAQRKGGKKR